MLEGGPYLHMIRKGVFHQSRMYTDGLSSSYSK